MSAGRFTDEQALPAWRSATEPSARKPSPSAEAA